VWEAVTGKEIAVLRGHEDFVTSAHFSPDGKWIVTASYDGTARVWEAAGKEVATLRGHEGPIYDAQFSPDGQWIVTASSDITARVWETVTGKEVAVLRGHEGVVNSAQFSPDERHIVTASDDGTARVYLAHIEDLIALARSRVTRELTCDERVQYLHEDRVCPTPTPEATTTP
jgi:WD40 repeat protein